MRSRCPFSGGVVSLLGCHLGAGTAKGAPGGGVGASLGETTTAESTGKIGKETGL